MKRNLQHNVETPIRKLPDNNRSISTPRKTTSRNHLPSSEGEDLSSHVERRKPVSLSGASLCRQVGPDHAIHFQKLLYPACNTTLGRHSKNDAGHQLKVKNTTI